MAPMASQFMAAAYQYRLVEHAEAVLVVRVVQIANRDVEDSAKPAHLLVSELLVVDQTLYDNSM